MSSWIGSACLSVFTFWVFFVCLFVCFFLFFFSEMDFVVKGMDPALEGHLIK